MNRELLERPFDAAQIKQRQGAFGDLLDYVEGASVIQRLNDALESDWSFDIVEYKIDSDEVLVLGRLSHEGITKAQFGKSAITRSRKDNAVVSVGDDLKAAATDALKKCATLFGVGLHLYFEANNGHKEETQPQPQPQPSAKVTPIHENGRLTARQLSAIYAIARSRGMQNRDVRSYAQRMFNKVPDYLSRQEASTIIQQLQDGDGRA